MAAIENSFETKCFSFGRREESKCFRTTSTAISSKKIFVHSNLPKAVPWSRSTYRNNVERPRGIQDYYNMMWDRRIRRGTTIVPTIVPQDKKDGGGNFCQEKAMKAQRESWRKAKAEKAIRTQSPPPVEGRKNFSIQTEELVQFLEEECAEKSISTQTEPFEKLPEDNFFVKVKLGVDTATEILPGDLFDFDKEMTPIVEKLTCKVIEQALFEVMEEEELEAIKDQQNKFLEKRCQEQKEVRLLQEKEQRLQAEKAILAELKCRELCEEKEVEDRLGAGIFSSSYLGKLIHNSVSCLHSEGFIKNQSLGTIEKSFVPWINSNVKSKMRSNIEISRLILDDIIQNAVKNREQNKQ